MNTSDYIIEYLKSEDKAQLYEFYKENHILGEQIKTFFDWRESADAAIASNNPIVARFNRKIIGVVNNVPVTLRIGEKRINAAWHADSVVTPCMRGKGIAKNLVMKAASDYEIILAKGSHHSMYHLRKSLGFKDVINSNYLIKVLTPFKKGGTIKMKVGYFVYYFRSISQRPEFWQNSSVKEINSFDHEKDFISNELINYVALQIEKSDNYLKWRYLSCPGKKYELSSFYFNNINKGIIILRTNKKPGKPLWIVDMICNINDPDAIQGLLWIAFNNARLSGSSDIRIFATNNKIRSVLFKYGFKNTSFTPHFTFLCNNQDLANTINDIDWNFFHGDGDVELYMD